jgi:hypothetical protein
MKSKTISLRIEEKDRARWGKAAREYKNLSAFFLHMVADAFRYRALIAQAKKMESNGVKKTALKVMA